MSPTSSFFLLFTNVLGVVVLLKHLFQGHLLVHIRKRGIFKYFDICKLIHDPQFAINGPNTILGETCRYHDASLSSLCAAA